MLLFSWNQHLLFSVWAIHCQKQHLSIPALCFCENLRLHDNICSLAVPEQLWRWEVNTLHNSSSHYLWIMRGGANYSWPLTCAWLNTASWKQILVGWEQQARHALLQLPLAYLHGQLIASPLSDGFLMGWEDVLLNTAQQLRFNYRARLLLPQPWHSSEELGRERGGWQKLLGLCCPFPPSHWNTDFPSHVSVRLSCKIGKTHGLLMISEKLLSHESAHGKHCWKSLHSESLEIRPRQTHNCPLRSTWNTNGSSLLVRDNHPGHPQVKAVHYKFQWWMPKPSLHRGPWTVSNHDRQREQDWNSVFTGATWS